MPHPIFRTQLTTELAEALDREVAKQLAQYLSDGGRVGRDQPTASGIMRDALSDYLRKTGELE